MLTSNQGEVTKKVLYAEAVYGDEEKAAVMESLENGWLASGPRVAEFEKQVAALFGKKYGIAVNSGSSANLLAFTAYGFPEGSKVITPALTFSTTVSEIIFNNLVPVFIDSVIGRYTIDEDLIEAAIDDKTVAIMVPQLIGGICDMRKIRDIANRHNLVVIDDSCDTFAPQLDGKTVASYADVSTTSFYGSHIITACGVGGMIMTDDEKMRDTLVTLRDWGRVGNDKEEFDSRFDFEIDGIPYDSKFIYSHLGFNLKMNEVCAAFGLEQLKRLNGFLFTRRSNFHQLLGFFKKYEQWLHMPELIAGATTNWLSFPLTIKPGAPFTRYQLLKHLEAAGIQTRVIFSGNITRHPVYKNKRYEIYGKLDNSDWVMAHGFLLGCHQGMNIHKEVKFIMDTVDDFMSSYL